MFDSAALASLAAILGYPTLQNFELIDETTPFQAPPPNVDALIQDAIQKRPDLSSLQYTYQSAEKFRNAV